MRAKKTASLVCLLPMLSACATIVDSSTSKINVTTNPPANATCSAVNKRGEWNVATPGNMEVKKSKTDLNVTCTDPRSGVNGAKTVESTVDPWVFGNVVIGGLIGLGIDWGTGAAYEYPKDVVVPLQQAAQPAYQYAPAPGTQLLAPASAPAATTYIAPAGSQPVVVTPAPTAPALAPMPTPAPAQGSYVVVPSNAPVDPQPIYSTPPVTQ